MSTQLEQTKLSELKWLRQVAGEMAQLSVRRMQTELPWFAGTPSRRRQLLTVVVQSGIDSFIHWYENPNDFKQVTGLIFGNAPRELLQSVSLQQTLQMTQIVVTVIEERVAKKSPALRETTLLFSREVAFAAAQVYARAAEVRGLWDARLEALIVDSIITGTSDDELPSRIAALGWNGQGEAAVVVGSADRSLDIDELRREVRKHHCDVLIGLQGTRLVLVLGVLEKQDEPTASQRFKSLTNDLKQFFTDDPIVLGPTVESLVKAHISARAALNGITVAAARSEVHYPIHADDLLPERVIAGDPLAKQTLLLRAYKPLSEASGELLPTLRTYLAQGRSLEATARVLYVHTNTVRYRLKRIYELIGWQPTEARDAFTLHTALVLGEISQMPRKKMSSANNRHTL
ncbi:PucR family transcriptional regulator [Canibacter zhoujuaniae]|uniref:PucR family transcriptional regulator n=1 Tax=Canibacter zhoujuaniae TaxID=2708343 RepID=UPI00141E4F53|nr:helix-turn-helix domain-containing protein [Canibacter zhoujuaniae]